MFFLNRSLLTLPLCPEKLKISEQPKRSVSLWFLGFCSLCCKLLYESGRLSGENILELGSANMHVQSW